VMMTSLGRRGDVRRLEEIGFAAYLTKPVRRSDLFDSLAAVLSGDTRKSRRLMVTRHSIREMRRRNVRILVAEDNFVDQQVVLGILKKLGLSAKAVANGTEAVKSLEGVPYDLVLMDVQMPEMDRIEATVCIRDPQSGVRNHYVRIIALTAHAWPATGRSAWRRAWTTTAPSRLPRRPWPICSRSGCPVQLEIRDRKLERKRKGKYRVSRIKFLPSSIGRSCWST